MQHSQIIVRRRRVIQPDQVGVIVPSSTPPSYTYGGAFFWEDGTTSKDVTVDLGAADAGRVVLLGFDAQGGPDYSGATASAAGTSLSKITATVEDDPDGFYTAFYSGVVASGAGNQTVNFTLVAGGGFAAHSIHVWTLRGLGSTSPRATMAAPNNPGGGTLAVVSGDFLFAVNQNVAGSVNFSTGSSSAVTRQDSVNTTSSFWESSADWAAPTPNASFVVTPGGFTGATSAVTFR